MGPVLYNIFGAHERLTKVVLGIRIRSDSDLFGRLRLLALKKDHVLTFLMCVKPYKLKESQLFNFLV
jgi:hypothetical protein